MRVVETYSKVQKVHQAREKRKRSMSNTISVEIQFNIGKHKHIFHFHANLCFTLMSIGGKLLKSCDVNISIREKPLGSSSGKPNEIQTLTCLGGAAASLKADSERSFEWQA